MKVGVRDHFDSMHSLPGHPKCGVPHGHTYTVEVVVEGEMDNGMVIDFGILKKSLKGVLDVLDHDNLNKFLEYPSCENIAVEVHSRMKQAINTDKKLVVRVWEGDGKWAEYESEAK